ncbi:MAG: flagellar motor switch phosphatase FliY [Anaeromusa sp.]|uniref:flagellar motor switch phosphatase FliY n=1 Tax=Anaeromusa sp. TaxID=1872520 RepID=UPI002B1F876A|nr:flagellar motor switch phosphatase FliY [Anaeromusa sp.]MEA4834279.1 flagellar motor switch phosphatase FliY [Anaeromusa sp.]
MSESFLSQEELDALLKGEAAPEAASGEVLSDVEHDALGEIGNISMGSAATTLSILLGKRVSITTPKVGVSSLKEIQNACPLPFLVVEVGYTHGVHGTNLLAIKESDALIIADLMMGNDGTNPPTELNELYMSAVGEAMNQMMGSVATSMSTMFKQKIDISPPKANLIHFATHEPLTSALTATENVVRVAFRMEVEDLIDSEIMQILPVEVARTLVKNLMGDIASQQAAAPAAPAQPVAAPTAPQTAPPMAAAAPAPAAAMPPQQGYYAPPQPSYQQPQVPVQAVQFSPLVPGAMAGVDGNIGLILDVPLQVTVELGRTKKLIREILELSPGSVLELDKLAGEPVDVLVNGKLLAKGEVVVIDENFGVRITDIVSPIERASSLQ